MKNFTIKYWPITGIVLLLMVICFYLIKSRQEIVDDLVLSDIVLEEGIKLENTLIIQNNPEEGAKWMLDAEEVKFSKDSQQISFKSFKLKLGSENSPFIELEGREGEYDKESNKINLRGDLNAKTENGYRIITEHIIYRQKEGCLNTEEPVKIIGPFFSIAGKGLHLNLEKQNLTIISDVTTLIDRESLVL